MRATDQRHDPPVRSARLLRRRRPGDPDRRAGAEEIRRAGLCPPRDRPQPLRRRGPAGAGRRLHRGTGRDTRRARHCPVVFSAHGVPKSVPADAEARNLFYLDATCPLVSKVHKQAMRHQRLGRHVVLVGHAGHPEVIGTMGQLPEGSVTLVETEEDAARLQRPEGGEIGFVTQTTLSVDDTAGVVRRVGAALSGHQGAGRRIDLLCHHQPPGSGQAGRSRRRPVPRRGRAELLQLQAAGRGRAAGRGGGCAARAACVEDIPWHKVGASAVISLSAGASAPEIIVDEIVEAFRAALRHTCRPGHHGRGNGELSGHARPARRRTDARRHGLSQRRG
jgi:hypothetical protein